MTDTVSSAELDAILASIFMTPEGKADPYPGFATVREAAQIHHSALGLKVATRYDDVNAILRDNRFGRGEQRFDPARSASRRRSSTSASPTRRHQ